MASPKLLDQIRSRLTIQEIASYTKHGCKIYPGPGEKLYLIEYWAAVGQVHSSPRDFGSRCYEDGLDAAKQLATETFAPETPLSRLELPDYVFTVNYGTGKVG